MSDEKPCPFCDSDNVVVTEAPGITGCYVICHNCGATGPKTLNWNRAVDLWESALRKASSQRECSK
jgi:transcription elongation factor Elf1